MKQYYLLPHRFEKVGWLLLSVAIALIIVYELDLLPQLGPTPAFTVIPSTNIFGVGYGFLCANDDWWDEINMILLYVSLYFIAMSALRQEDEMTLSLRLKSLLWAFTVSTGLIIFLELFVYGFSFIYVMMYQSAIIFLLFIIRFKFEIYKMRRNNYDE